MGIIEGTCDICGKGCPDGYYRMTDRWDKNGRLTRSGHLKRSSVNVLYCKSHSDKEIEEYVDKAYAENPDRDDDIDIPRKILEILSKKKQ